MQRVSNMLRKFLLAPIFFTLLVCASFSIADQNHSTLAALFEQLKNTESNSDTEALHQKIWAAWREAPDANAEHLISQLTAAMSSGNYELALRLSDQLIDTNPDFAEAWNKRATLHYLMGNHAYSVSDIKQTLLLEPRHFGALSGLGLIFMASGNYEAAVDAFESVLDISPGSDNAAGNLARAKALIGNEI